MTELVTGLGMLGFDTVDRALVHQPAEMVDVDARVWERVVAAWGDRRYRTDVAGAFRNGRVFLESRDGLRGRRPVVIEWKGGQRAIGAEPVPVDLRVDHVFLVSCKYASRILLNAAPGQLFGAPDVVDWYAEVAPEQYQALYRHVRSDVGAEGLPPRAADLARHHRAALREALGPAGWDGDGSELYATLSAAVSEATADRWRDRLVGRRRQEAMLWRLLRIGAAPYYVLGASRDQTLRLRVTTPWDWRRRFEFRRFDVWADQAGQPRVGWRAAVRDHTEGADRTVDGHVEIRWSHGRFAQAPEAKVYLDTPHADVPGYVPLR